MCKSKSYRFRGMTPRLTSGPSSAPTKRCKTFIKRKRWCVEHPVLMTQVLQLWQLRRPFFVLFEEFSKPNEIGINTCLILQNTLDVTVTALAVQNKREHHNRVKGFVETVVPNYCDPTFASHFRMKRQTFQMKDNSLLTSETVMIYMNLLFFCEYYTYYCWSLLLCYDIVIFAII